ncbi:uncharacterized protein [Rutidosis leptorrhynchoides]|uniref:uncharacterized protein n=1 Tax=Rutidosis leptorrhynchoides TaxID=125765 RepID=UPI003A99ED56
MRLGISKSKVEVSSVSELVLIFKLAAQIFMSKVSFYSLLVHFATLSSTQTIAAHQIGSTCNTMNMFCGIPCSGGKTVGSANGLKWVGGWNWFVTLSSGFYAWIKHVPGEPILASQPNEGSVKYRNEKSG